MPPPRSAKWRAGNSSGKSSCVLSRRLPVLLSFDAYDVRLERASLAGHMTSASCGVQGRLRPGQRLLPREMADSFSTMHSLYQSLKELGWDTFQRFIFQLLSERHPGLEIKHVEGAAGDRGADIFAGQLNDHPKIWQCKHFPNGLGTRQRPQVRKSLRDALRYYKPSRWVLVTSVDLDSKAHSWFQKLQRSYARDTEVGLFQASDIIRELVHRRSIGDSFFPQAVVDTVTLNRCLQALDGPTSGDLDKLVQRGADELIARLEEADGRFDYHVAYGPNIGAQNALAQPSEALHIATVQYGDKRTEVFARDLEAIRLDPPTVKMQLPYYGARKINDAIRTGRAQELTTDEVRNIRSTFDFLLPEHERAGWKVVLQPNPQNPSNMRPLRLTFTKGDESVLFESVQFRIVRAGTEEAEIQSVSPLPFILSLVLPGTGSGKVTLSF